MPETSHHRGVVLGVRPHYYVPRYDCLTPSTTPTVVTPRELVRRSEAKRKQAPQSETINKLTSFFMCLSSLHTEPAPAVRAAVKTILSCQSFALSPETVHFGCA